MPRPRRHIFAAILPSVLCLVLLSASAGQALELSQPIRCDYGVGCFVQNYVDVDPSPDAADFTCGALTYDGHKGTDFRIPWADYRKGVEVLAAAPGAVLRVRDSVEDRDARGHEEEVRPYGLGNAVIIEHEDGYQTVYAHMKQGSVRVKEGDRVERGQVLGLVGLSGLTVFPHLHFGVTRDGHAVCPFLGRQADLPALCGTPPDPLWGPKVRIGYIPTGLIRATFLDARPEFPAVLREPEKTTLRADSSAIVFAVAVFGTRAGDRVEMRILDPLGRVVSRADSPIEKTQAQRLIYIGKRLEDPKKPWLAGTYQGEYRLLRGGKTVVRASSKVEVR
ncbi:M23 family metallopeptidase [Pseudodesulfovibrio sp.]|uniref:M23 family metallopeptidase n=1 Tax=Pseudodesulfovibrio sp. TaxID=2035812 RepID=UPI002631B039|nr:M23 family metallopeptidase [Pseudodesulfovibrio sp.]MDD3311368.1 M23 family metallopeptidase [Pseudodesulfovibrio sp.]